MRAAGYRELFFANPLEPDQFTLTNPWRPRTATSNENQQERYGQVQVGNPDLDPERSRTMTVGFVLQPGGWAQGMRFSADYSDIRVKDGITCHSTPTCPCLLLHPERWSNPFDEEGNVTIRDQELRSHNRGAIATFAEQNAENGNPIPAHATCSTCLVYVRLVRHGLRIRRGLSTSPGLQLLVELASIPPGSVS